MVKRALVLLSLVVFFSQPSSAEDYKFSVDQNRSDVFIREDGGIDIEYALTFTCAPSGKPIDIIDVGLPNRHYQLGSVQAWLNGREITEIRRSEVLAVGVEVHLGANKIRPDETKTLQLTAANPRMVYPDTEDDDMASVEFYPTYYGSQYTQGRTRLQVAIHFPPGASGDEVKWHHRKFDDYGEDEEGRLVFIWRDDAARPDQQYKFGVSFKKSLVDKVFDPERATISETLFPILGTIFFFGLPIGIFILIYYQNKRRRMKYLPPIASVEGAEIKRGLTAPEAAILLEAPLNKVLVMIIFGLAKKGFVSIEGSRLGLRFKKLVDQAKVERTYETGFMDAIKADGSLDDHALEAMLIKLIKSMEKKLRGFDVKKTRKYYQNIVALAWNQVKKSESVGDVSKLIENQFEWLMLDRDMDDNFKSVLSARQVRPPVWWRAYYADSGWGHGLEGGQVHWVSGVDFADKVVSRFESLADRAVSKLDIFTTTVTRTTNPPPVRTYSGGGSGGGCACACAGCACACAGGGR